ncbi:MAG: hypothetical protein H6559_00510 [Lewinellaceae bacterium]|nr:hypothetical protein [Lewinellaceae bacterium]
MNRSFSALVFFFFSGIFVFGQGLAKKVPVDGQILYEVKGDKLKIEAHCENQTDKRLSLTYKLSIEQHDSNNNTVSNSQGGKKELEAMESKTLSSTSVSWRKGSSLRATLKIYHKKKLLDTVILDLSSDSIEEKSEK